MELEQKKDPVEHYVPKKETDVETVAEEDIEETETKKNKDNNKEE